MKSDIKPTDEDVERARKGRSPEELAELAQKAKHDASLAEAIATLGRDGEAEPGPLARTPLQGTPVLPGFADDGRKTLPRPGGHRLQQSHIPTLPRFADVARLQAYEGDPEGEGEAQALKPIAGSADLTDPGALPLEALHEAAGLGQASSEGRPTRRRGAMLLGAVVLVVAVALGFALRDRPSAGGVEPSASVAGGANATSPSGPASTAPIAAGADPQSTSSAVASAPNSAAAIASAAPQASAAPSSAPSAAPSATGRAPSSAEPASTRPRNPNPEASSKPAPTSSSGGLPPGWSPQQMDP
jgi:hypothetical protein